MSPGHFTDSNLDRAFDSMVRNVNQLRRRTPGRFRAEASVISVNSLLKTPPGHRYHFSRLVDERHNTAVLTLDFDGNKYSFPAQLQAVLDAMCRRGSFCLKDLPGGLNSEAIVDLAGYLQSIGFLTAMG
jgi:putative NADPH-quinone reductase